MARKILLADDSVTAQNMGRKILADAGYEVLTVNNGSAALKRINEVKPDLIVLDVYMPGYSGLEVCQRLKEAKETSHIPVLLTVGKLEPFKPDEAKRAKADAHIVKPFEASELLSAIARLEDRMVAYADGRRAAAPEEESVISDDPDNGWKSRLRFPSKKKKKEEPADTELEEATGNFRNFRKGKGKTASSTTAAGSGAEAQEPAIVPDIPRDITPEELDALSALAEKLDGPVGEVPAAGQGDETVAIAAKAVEAQTPETKPIEAKLIEAKPEEEAPRAEVKVAEAKPVEAAVAAAPREFEVPAPPVEAVSAAAAKSEIEIPSQQKAAAAASLETQVTENQASSMQPITAAEASTASLPKDATPADHRAEPAFAVTPPPIDAETSAAEAVAEAVAAEKIVSEKILFEKISAEAIEKPVAAHVDEASKAAEARVEEAKAVEAKAAELKAEPPTTEVPKIEAAIEAAKVDEPKAEDAKPAEGKHGQPGTAESAPPAAVAGKAAEAVEADAPAPSDEELAEALRLLTPATGNGEAAGGETKIPTPGTLVAAGQMLAEEAARNAAAAPRWVAQAVALTPEEAAISLEAEMFKTFAAAPAKSEAESATVEVEAATVADRLSLITAAVENRLAESNLEAVVAAVASGAGFSPAAGSEAGVERASAQADAIEAAVTVNAAIETAERETAKTEAAQLKVETMEATREEVALKESATAFEPPAAQPAVKVVAASSASAAPAEQPNSVTEKLEERVSDDAAPATFADAASQYDTEAAAPAIAQAQSANDGVSGANESEVQDSNTESGGEAMGSDGKKTGKSNWHQIHTPSAAGAAGSKVDAVEAAKQAAAEEAPKAMAAAAAAESSSATAPEANAIANIVDSVLADLRPKIVEEIAKKLAGK